MADLIDGFIARAWREAGLEPNLPPFEFLTDLDEDTGLPVVILGANGIEDVFLTVEQARAAAQGLRDLLTGAAPRFVVSARYESFRAGLLGERKGRGFSFRVADNLDRDNKAIVLSGLTRSVASDLARAFEVYADKAAKLQVAQ